MAGAERVPGSVARAVGQGLDLKIDLDRPLLAKFRGGDPLVQA